MGGAEFEWRLTAHICRACFGRVLVRSDGGVYRCSNCGAQREGKSAAAICACGMKLRTGKDAGVRCVLNPQPTPMCPSEVVAEQVEKS